MSVGWWEVAGEPAHSRSFPVWCLFSLTLAVGPGSRSLNLSSIVGKKKVHVNLKDCGFAGCGNPGE